MKSILLIYRASEYSPNNVDRDKAILDEVGDCLHCHFDAVSEPHVIHRCSEEQLPAHLDDYDIIFHMARRLSTLMMLERLRHVLVVNATRGVRNVAKSRELTMMLLQAAGVPIPEWWAYDPELDEMFQCDASLQRLLPGWIKAMRTDGARQGDVTFVSTPLQADALIIELSAQQVPDITLSKHLEGDLIKCYCVYGNGQLLFLRWFYPKESGYSKFGDAEQHNSPLARLPIHEEQLQKLAGQVAQALGLQVFGFDAIVQPGDPSVISVIDVNDWPTFGLFRREAAEAIVRLL